MNLNSHLVPMCIIYLDGVRLSENALKSIIVHDRLNGISQATLTFDESMVDCEFQGSLIAIHLGYKDTLNKVFEGDVTGIRLMLKESESLEVEILCHSMLHRLHHGKRERCFENKTPAEAIQEILNIYSLQADVEPFGVAVPRLYLEDHSDLEFVLALAHRYGKEVYASGSTIYVASEITVSNDEIIFEQGKNLMHVAVTENIQGLFTHCTCIGHDMLQGQSFAGSADLEDITLIGGTEDWRKLCEGETKGEHTTISYDCHDSAEAKILATACLQNNSWNFAQATVKVEGTNKIFPGMRVTLKNVGTRFCGEYIADVVTHSLDYEGYQTNVRLKRNTNPAAQTGSVPGAQLAHEAAQERSAAQRRDEEERREATQRTEQARNPTIQDPQWCDASGTSIAKAHVGDAVLLCADTQDIPEGSTVSIAIVEYDDDGNHDEVTTLRAVVKGNRIKATWKVVYTEDVDDSNSAEEEERLGYTLPEYIFKMKYQKIEVESGRLDIMGWIKDKIIDKDTGKEIQNTYRIIFPDGTIENGIRVEDGSIILNDTKYTQYHVLLLKDK